MDTVRFFKDHAKAELKAARAVDPRTVARLTATLGAGETPPLQQVQHRVAVNAGFRSWRALLQATEPERQLAAVMPREPLLNNNGMGYGSFHRTKAERLEAFEEWRTELRAATDIVEQVSAWLLANIEPIRTINRRTTSYGIKHTVERATGRYVTNGQLIAAAIITGYPYAREERDSPNVCFGMSTRSLRAAGSGI